MGIVLHDRHMREWSSVADTAPEDTRRDLGEAALLISAAAKLLDRADVRLMYARHAPKAAPECDRLLDMIEASAVWAEEARKRAEAGI